MYKLPKKVETLTPYEPICGNYKIRLDANESFFTLTNEELELAVTGLPINRYPDPYASETVEAFGRLYDVNPRFVTAGNGSDEIISIITACLFEKGDKILTFQPDFSMYAFYPYLYELEICELQKNEDLEIDVDQAIEYINQNDVKAVLFSNPCNPTSLGMTAKDAKRLVNETKALIILDEAYMEFWDSGESLVSLAPMYPNLIVLKTCSKAIALAGIRLGFAVANIEITNALKASKSPYNVNVITQSIGRLVLSDREKIIRMSHDLQGLAKSLKNRIEMLGIADFVKIFDTVTNFVFIRTKNEQTANLIYEFLLKNDIVIRKMGSYIRITTGNPEENAVLLDTLEKYKEETK